MKVTVVLISLGICTSWVRHARFGEHFENVEKQTYSATTRVKELRVIELHHVSARRL